MYIKFKLQKLARPPGRSCLCSTHQSNLNLFNPQESEYSDLSCPIERIEGGGEEDNADWNMESLRDAMLMVDQEPEIVEKQADLQTFVLFEIKGIGGPP